LEGYERLRNRALDVVRNDWAGASSVQKWTTALVGVGIQPRWANQRYREIWDRWVPEADADCVLDAYGLQTLATGAWFSAGEVFLRRRPRSLDAPLTLPVQTQVIESHLVPMIDYDSHPKLPKEHTIRQGIERNRFGRRTAIWMYPDHPGDPVSRPDVRLDELIRVPASEVSHMFEPTRPGQLRGVSGLASVLIKLRASMDFEDAVLDRQKLANLFMAIIKRQMPPDWADIQINQMTGLPKWYDSEGRSVVGLEPGLTQDLMPGEDMTFTNPPEAGTTYTDYMRTSHMGTSAGQSLPYEFMSGDIREVSDRTLRIVVNEFRRFAEQRQWQILVPMHCQPTVRWVGQAAVLSGRLTASEYDTFIRPEWSPHGWEYIHPVQDVEAAVKARDAGFTSTSRVIAKRGDDPRVVLAERQADEASGLTPQPPAPVATASDGAAARAANAQALLAEAQLHALQRSSTQAPAREEASPLEHFIAGLAGVQASIGQMAGSVAALAARPQEIHNHLPPSEVRVDNHTHVEPTPVEVYVDPTPVIVEPSVAAVDVHVPEQAPPVVNNVVNVEPAEVRVELPDRETTSAIERDHEGNIRKVTQVERTVQ
jgi:lambda family phage portal protein